MMNGVRIKTHRSYRGKIKFALDKIHFMQHATCSKTELFTSIYILINILLTYFDCWVACTHSPRSKSHKYINMPQYHCQYKRERFQTKKSCDYFCSMLYSSKLKFASVLCGPVHLASIQSG